MQHLARVLCAAILVLAFAPRASAGEVTLTTYYPAPTGNYDHLTAYYLKAGDQTKAVDCDATAGGTIRYNNKLNPQMEFCNGFSWQPIGVVFQNHLPSMPRPPNGLTQWPNYIVCSSIEGDNWILPLNGSNNSTSDVHYVIDQGNLRVDYNPRGEIRYAAGVNQPCLNNTIADLCKKFPSNCLF